MAMEWGIKEWNRIRKIASLSIPIDLEWHWTNESSSHCFLLGRFSGQWFLLSSVSLCLLSLLRFRILQWWQKDVVHLSWWNQIELVQYQQLRSDTERGGRKGNNLLIKKAIGISTKLTSSGCISNSSTTTAVGLTVIFTGTVIVLDEDRVRWNQVMAKSMQQKTRHKTNKTDAVPLMTMPWFSSNAHCTFKISLINCHFIANAMAKLSPINPQTTRRGVSLVKCHNGKTIAQKQSMKDKK